MSEAEWYQPEHVLNGPVLNGPEVQSERRGSERAARKHREICTGIGFSSCCVERKLGG